MRRLNIATAGLTAAGKTTHGRLLASAIGYDYVSATDILLKLVGLADVEAEQAWFSSYDRIQEARAGYAVDIELERRLLQMASTREGVVFDTWALAWISPSPMVRIWIESDVESRARKCFISQPEQALDLNQCRDLILRKDSETRDNFLERHEFDLIEDRERYDLILDNTELIPEATRECSELGIATFAPIVTRAVAAIRSGSHDDMSRLIDDFPANVTKARAIYEDY